MLTDKKMLRNFERTRPLKVSACCKHYTAYDVENWQSVDRLSFDARVSNFKNKNLVDLHAINYFSFFHNFLEVPEQDMAETLQVPFETCGKEGYFCSVMCSYSKVNGVPTCSDPRLLKQTTRDEWNGTSR